MFCYRLFKCLFLLGVICSSVGICRAETIGDIFIAGNAKTDERILYQEMVIFPGDTVDIKKIEDSIQYIKNLNLFEKVIYRLEKKAASEQVDLYITVKERYFLFLLPHLKFDETGTQTGLRLKWNNVFGLNHTLSWQLIDTGSSFGVDEYRNLLDYTLPRIAFSTYQFILLLNKVIVVNDDPVSGPQKQVNDSYGFEILKWLKKQGASSGYFVGAGIASQTRDSTAILPTDSSKGSFQAVTYALRGGYEEIDEFLYNRDGYFVEYIFGFASEDIGAEQGGGFVSHQLEYRRYHSLDESTGRSVNVLLRVATATDDVLGEPAFYLGGNGTLRGYDKNSYRGNAVVNSSLEYLDVFDVDPHIRKVLFVDFGGIYPDYSDFDLSDFKVGAGAGIRIKAKKFINIDLRLDLAYGFDNDEFRLSFGSRHTF